MTEPAPRVTSAQGTHGDGLGRTSGLIPQACGQCDAALVIVCPNGCADPDVPRVGPAKRTRVYRPRVCHWPDCGTTFTPSGPASKFCPAHQK